MEQDAARPSRLRLVALVLVIAVAWGLMYSSYKVGLQRAGPLWLASLRFEFFAVACIVAGLAVRNALRFPSTGGDVAAIVAYGGLNVVIHNLGTIGGAGHVPVAVIGVLAGTTPILTAGFAWLVPPRSRFGPRTLVGLLLGFLGVAALALSRTGAGRVEVSAWALVVLGGFAAWALGTVLIRASGSQLHGLSLGLWGSLAAIAILQPAAWALEAQPRFDWVLIAVAAFAGIVGGVIAFLLWLGLVRRHGARQANLVSYVSPIATTLSGAAFLGEPLSAVVGIAYGLIASGLWLVVKDLPRTHIVVASEAEATGDAALQRQ